MTTPILAATSGILSWVSSTTGVVMPALFPICSEVVVKFAPSLHYQELIAAVTATSFAAAISPLSTGGAIIMSSISASKETTNEENNKMFKDLFLLSVANVAINVLLSALGVFSLGGLFYGSADLHCRKGVSPAETPFLFCCDSEKRICHPACFVLR